MYACIIFLIFHFFVIQIVSHSSYYNYDLHNHLGTKTPYRIIENNDITPIYYPGCEPVKIWMVVRHGTRLPSEKFIDKMTIRLPQLRDEIIKNSKTYDIQLSKLDLTNLQKWDISIDRHDEKILTHEGENEMINLGERMQLRLSNIFPQIYSNTSYKFKYTATQRTQQSAHYFATGLFGRKGALSVWYPQALHKDPILRFYKLCERWTRLIKENLEAMKEQDLFIRGPVVQNVVKTISVKLGFKDDLTFDDIHIMYLTCAFETSWSKTKLSPWCAVFSNETIKILEYVEDIKYYWIDGPGYDLTYQQACPAIKNLEEYFSNEDVYPKAVVYFTHSGTILKLLAHLGLYKDKLQLKHDNFASQSERLWRVSKIDAFASNIAAVLFRCNDTKKILFLHQEKIIQIRDCSGELCNFITFLNTFNESINNCNFNEMCSM